MISKSLHTRVRLLAQLVDEFQMHVGMLKILADNSHAINESTFKRFFRILQMDIANISIITAAKIFEESRKNKQYSIPAIKRLHRIETCPYPGKLRFELDRAPVCFRPPTCMRETDLMIFILKRLKQIALGCAERERDWWVR
jgi:hypothetical protein